MLPFRIYATCQRITIVSLPVPNELSISLRFPIALYPQEVGISVIAPTVCHMIGFQVY